MGFVRKRADSPKVIELNVVMPVVMQSVGKRFAERQDVVAGGWFCVRFSSSTPFTLYILFMEKHQAA